MNKIRLIIFDLDGTLVDAYRAIINSSNYTMQELGLPKQRDELIRAAVGWGDEALLKPFVGPKNLNQAIRIYRRHHARSLLSGSRLFTGVRMMLAQLKRKGYILAIASNRPTKFTRILMRRLGITRYFAYVLCADKLKVGKPHPEILRKIMRRFSLAPSQALYVGDMTIDAEAGRRAKVKTIIVTTGSSTVQEIKKEFPFKIIPKVADLAFLLS